MIFGILKPSISGKSYTSKQHSLNYQNYEMYFS